MRKAEFIYCFTCQSKKRMKSAGAFGGPIRLALIPGLFSMAHWSRIRKAIQAPKGFAEGMFMIAVAKKVFFKLDLALRSPLLFW